MKTILAILALCLCLSASTAQIIWTAYTSAVQNTTCDPQNTNFYDVLNLATDSQGRAWQFGGRGCPDSPSYLRYFDRTNRGWTLEWKVGDSEGPESRNDNLIWIDKDNNIYVYGGQTFGNIVLCDFWKYSISSKTWTNLTVADGSLNSVDRGSADATNYPGCRRGSARWYTPDDNSIWIFSGVVTYEDNEFLPDLWRFNMTSQLWTFVAGDLKEVTESTVFSDPLDVTPFQRWGAYSAVDAQYNLWLYGGEFMSDLWMFDRTSGWQHIGGSANISEGFGCGNTYPPITGNFSSEIQPACAAYSSMTYAGSNILALWTSYTSSGSLGLWLYNITSKQWANFDGFNSIAVADVLYLPDESTSPGYVEYTRAHAHGSIWIVSDDSYGVFVMDLQCLDLVNPCSELATCTLNPSQPAPTCTCTEGYEGDGVTCSLIPPVAPSAAPTSVSTPTNIPIGSKTSSTSRIVAALSSVLALFVWAL